MRTTISLSSILAVGHHSSDEAGLPRQRAAISGGTGPPSAKIIASTVLRYVWVAFSSARGLPAARAEA
jgi:hypothetical protein